jgi:hypothetical protein
MKTKVIVGLVCLLSLNLFAKQEVKFCMKQYRYGNSVQEQCEIKCKKYQYCSASDLIQQEYKIIDSYQKNITLEDFETFGDKIYVHPWADDKKKNDLLCKYNAVKCYKDKGGIFYWENEPQFLGCQCEGREYIVEKIKK